MRRPSSSCCTLLSTRWDTSSSTLPSTQESRYPFALVSAQPCRELGPSEERWYTPCAFGVASLSASRPASLDVSFFPCCWDPGLRPAVGPSHGLCRLHGPTTGLPPQGPHSFVEWPLVVPRHHRPYVAIGLLRIAAAFPIGDVGHQCRGWHNLAVSSHTRDG